MEINDKLLFQLGCILEAADGIFLSIARFTSMLKDSTCDYRLQAIAQRIAWIDLMSSIVCHPSRGGVVCALE